MASGGHSRGEGEGSGKLEEGGDDEAAIERGGHQAPGDGRGLGPRLNWIVGGSGYIWRRGIEAERGWVRVWRDAGGEDR